MSKVRWLLIFYWCLYILGRANNLSLKTSSSLIYLVNYSVLPEFFFAVKYVHNKRKSKSAAEVKMVITGVNLFELNQFWIVPFGKRGAGNPL